MLKKVFVFTFILFFFMSITVSAEIIYLKDGTKIIGKILNMNDKEVTIETDIGILKITRDKISSIQYEDESEKTNKKNQEESDLLYELRINKLRNRKGFDLIGITSVWGLTIVGDLAVGGEFLVGSAIPIVGPFINVIQIKEGNYLNETRDITLSLLSGVIQSALFVDYLFTMGKQNKLRKSFSYNIIPTRKGIYIEFNINFWNPVEKNYLEIAEISIRLNKKTREYGVAYLREKAMELGADAIILLGERSRGAVALPAGNMFLAVPIKDLCAIAIKYK